MTDRDRPSSPKRRAFLHGATSAGVASVLAPHTALARASAPANGERPAAIRQKLEDERVQPVVLVEEVL
jgi:hypothetical protein